MGTRAAFFIGDPRNVDDREWLGCIAWDGYPEGDCAKLANCATENAFRVAVQSLKDERDDFADPSGGWPFPWDDDLFLTDHTYFFVDGRVWVECGRQLAEHAKYLAFTNDEAEAFYDLPPDPTLEGVPAPKAYDSSQPDSIIILSTGG